MDIDVELDPDDFPDVSEEMKAAVVEARSLWREIFMRRGQYLSEFNSIETFLRTAIANYFDRVGDDEFEAWVLGRLSTTDLIELAKQCVVSRGVAEHFADFFSALGHCVTFRNSIAHSHVAEYESTLEMMRSQALDLSERLLDPVSVQMKRKGRVASRGLLAELLRELDALDRLDRYQLKLGAALNRRIEGNELPEMFESVDRLFTDKGTWLGPVDGDEEPDGDS